MTKVVHHVLDPDGTPVIGRTVTVTLMLRLDVAPDSYDLNAPDPFQGNPISRYVVSTSDNAGLLSWDLVPNEHIVPSGSYYEVHGLGASPRTFLYVPDSAAVMELSECVLTLVDLGSSNLVLVQGPRGRQGGDTSAGGGAGLPVATPTEKGVLQLAGDLGGSAIAPTVTGGTHHTHTSAQISDASTGIDPNTLAKRDGNGWLAAVGVYLDHQDAAPYAAVRKDYADALGTPDSVPGAIARRDPNGLTAFAGVNLDNAPADPWSATRRDYVDQQVATRAAIAGDLGGTPSAPTVPGLTTKANVSHTHSVADMTATGTRDSTKFLRGDNVWAAAATLDGTGKIPQAQMPAVALTDFLGAVASQAAMLALTGQRGDWCTRTDSGTDWQLIADDPTQLANWRQHVYPASPVSSVAGRTGAVTLSGADITDSTATGRAVLTAASAAAARTTLGAGTGNGNVTGTGMATIAVLTQAAYTALGTKDGATLYVIVG